MRLNRHQKWLVAEAQRWAAVNEGEPPRVRDWKANPDFPSYITAVRAFRTWDQFIKECGWQPRGRGRPRKQ